MITPESAKEALEFLDVCAGKANGTREAHDNVRRAASILVEFIKQSTPEVVQSE